MLLQWAELPLRIGWSACSNERPKVQMSLTTCPTCGDEMTRIEKTTMTGDDMRTYRCDQCGKEHIVNFGPALWKVLSDAREADTGGRTDEESTQPKTIEEPRQRRSTGSTSYVRLAVIVMACLIAITLLVSSLMR
jgi:predicted RNA-binding Zn-ribbon protein involved in translation (DUF1610 family)